MAKFVHYHLSLEWKEQFLEEKRKGKRFLYFYDHASIKQVESNYSKKEHCKTKI